MAKTNQSLSALIEFLEKAGKENKADIWRDIALRLKKSNQRRAEVNVSRLDKHLKEGEIAVVPGKVLGTGEIKKKIIVSAFAYSSQAKDKLKNANCQILNLKELVAKVPKGTNVRIIG